MKKQANMDLQLSLFTDSAFEIKKEDTISEKGISEKGISKKQSLSTDQNTPIKSLSDTTPIKIVKQYDHSSLFLRLAQSDFRSSFHLKAKDKAYIQEKGLETIRQHAADFVAKRLAPAYIPNDGKQTPMRGHPVFLAQHATACCCRGCFYKWHHIPQGRALTVEEQEYAVSVLMAWITHEYNR